MPLPYTPISCRYLFVVRCRVANSVLSHFFLGALQGLCFGIHVANIELHQRRPKSKIDDEIDVEINCRKRSKQKENLKLNEIYHGHFLWNHLFMLPCTITPIAADGNWITPSRASRGKSLTRVRRTMWRQRRQPTANSTIGLQACCSKSELGIVTDFESSNVTLNVFVKSWHPSKQGRQAAFW